MENLIPEIAAGVTCAMFLAYMHKRDRMFTESLRLRDEAFAKTIKENDEMFERIVTLWIETQKHGQSEQESTGLTGGG